MAELKKTLAAVVAVLAILGGIYHGMRSVSESAPHDIDQVRARHLQTSSENAETRTDEKTESGTLDTQDLASEKTESGTLDTQGQPTASNVNVSSFVQTSGITMPPMPADIARGTAIPAPFYFGMKWQFNAVKLPPFDPTSDQPIFQKLTAAGAWVMDQEAVMDKLKIASSDNPTSEGPPQVYRVSLTGGHAELPWAHGARYYAWLHAIDEILPSGAFVYWKEDRDAVPDYLLRVKIPGRAYSNDWNRGIWHLDFHEIPKPENLEMEGRDTQAPNEVDGVAQYFYAPEVGTHGAFVYATPGGVRVFQTQR